MSGAVPVVHVVVEIGQKKSFASALDWPGWRGGGRDRDKIAAHVVEAEQSYARKLGLDKPGRRPDLRGDIVDAIKQRPTDTAWPMRYAARRIAWHVLDHTWEIEDRSEG